MRRALVLALCAPLGSCLGPPPSHALVVRNLEVKCALIAFSHCAALAISDPPARDEDASVTDEDAGGE